MRVLANGLRRVPRPLLVLALCLVAATTAVAQDPMRPWVEWKTLETPHFRIHFPQEYERWAIDVARRVEAVDSAITSLVGYRTTKRVDIVVHDPFVSPNGYAIPLLEATTTVWWPTPPDPRLDIGNYRTWGEMLATHELAHVAHLTRPSRNGWERFKWALLPASVGPITQRAPRWVREGYATVIEGQITGSGRPNGAWRPAMLREWAIEGRLPTYDGMNAVGAFRAGDFAYLSGSAYLEWLLKRQGDSTLTFVWRRMTAVTKRSFDQAFRGVYGDSPAMLYGQHTAELTGDAMRAKAALQRAGLREGDLVQRLTWETGDPALSPDGKRVAVALREGSKPSRLVVWNTEADSTSRRRTTARDPEDVPDKSFYPAARRVMRELPASNGTSFMYPRWFADNRRIMTTRWTVRPDGAFGPDLYIWNTSTASVSRLTHGEGLLQADPSPDSREAVAMRCHEGHCDVVRYYFAIGSVTSLLEGSPTRSYYRPRFSPDGQRFVASVSDSGRWQVVVADRDGKNARRIGPNDGANRYDGQWTASGDSLIVVSERGGVPNLEYLSLDGGVKSITRVTGAAVAPDVNREDRSIWFLSLHSRGFDVRRLASNAPIADSVVTLDAQQYGFAGVRQSTPVNLGMRPGQTPEYYGIGPSKTRWLPGAFASPDGVGGTFTLFRGDVVGRVGTTANVAYGELGTWRGASVRTAFRMLEPTIEVGVHAFDHQPSKGREAAIDSDSLDARGIQGAASVSQVFRREGIRIGARAGAGGGLIEPLLTDTAGVSLLKKRTRMLGFLDTDVQLRQMSGSRGAMERIRIHLAEGVMRTHFRRVMTTLELSSIGDVFPINASWTLGKHFGSRHTFEEFSIGGIESATMDTSLMRQRWSMPMLPTGSITGRGLQAWRIAVPTSRFTVYAEGVSLTGDNKSDKFTVWNRAIGIETNMATPVIPVSYAPAMQTHLGIGYSMDAPLHNKFRAYFTIRYDP